MELIIDIIGRGEAYASRRFVDEDVSFLGSAGFLVRRSAPDGGLQGEQVVAVSPTKTYKGFQLGSIINASGLQKRKIPIATLIRGDFMGKGIYSISFETREVPVLFNVKAPQWGGWEKTLRKL